MTKSVRKLLDDLQKDSVALHLVLEVVEINSQ
jgi:hypothetical protein